MPVTRAFPDAVTAVDTAAQYELGTEWPMDAGEAEALSSLVQGPQTWVYIEADEEVVLGTIVSFKTGTAQFTGVKSPVSSSPHRVIGVAQHTIAASSYGWILKRGMGEVLADTGGLSKDLGIIPGNAVAGRADNSAAVTNAAIGVCFDDGVAATALATCLISIP